MNKHDKLILIRTAISDSYMDVHDLVEMLELSVEDVVQLLPAKLLEFEHKFLLDSPIEDITDEERERQLGFNFDEEEPFEE